MRVFRMSIVDDRAFDPEWEIMETFNFDNENEARQFKAGYSKGLEKGRVDHCVVITDDEAMNYRIKNIFSEEMRPRLKFLELDFLLEYLSHDLTTFHIPDYKMSQALGVIENLLSRRG